MKRIKAEYIWLDGYDVANIRSKVKFFKTDSDIKELKDFPKWNFDGSSTRQAEGNSSDCILNPVKFVEHGFESDTYIVLCEVLNADGTPHATNTRSKCKEIAESKANREYWWGFEQEYFIMKNGKPLGWPETGYPDPQGKNYCSNGSTRVAGSNLSEEHADACYYSGLDITGTNAEVTLGQWEYQLFNTDTLNACDDLIISRFILERQAEEKGYDIELHPKPAKGDWNGSGCHTNFSTKAMREEGGEKLFIDICDRLSFYHDEHIAEYGLHNDERLTGLHETQAIDQYSYGVSDRGASIRIPENVSKTWKGYLEDRRPASNMDPYKVTSLIMKNLN